LKEKIFPQIAEQHTSDEPIRIWTLGCSTGEEAYSIAMSFAEFAADQAEHLPVQIFATDLSDRGIEKARAGLYPRDITQDVSPERLRRFFHGSGPVVTVLVSHSATWWCSRDRTSFPTRPSRGWI